LFFVSSRRRHTRFSRDWSSDVCSSDLQMQGVLKRPTLLRYLLSPYRNRLSSTTTIHFLFRAVIILTNGITTPTPFQAPLNRLSHLYKPADTTLVLETETGVKVAQMCSSNQNWA